MQPGVLGKDCWCAVGGLGAARIEASLALSCMRASGALCTLGIREVAPEGRAGFIRWRTVEDWAGARPVTGDARHWYSGDEHSVTV
jgi:hypothetical protein